MALLHPGATEPFFLKKYAHIIVVVRKNVHVLVYDTCKKDFRIQMYGGKNKRSVIYVLARWTYEIR